MDSIISLLTPKKATFYLDENSTIRQALEKFDYHKFTVVPLLDEQGRYCGTLSEGDILRFIKNVAKFNIKILEKTYVKDIERYRPYKGIKIDADIKEVFDLSLSQNFIPIMDDKGTYIGIVTRKEVIKSLSDKNNEFPKL